MTKMGMRNLTTMLVKAIDARATSFTCNSEILAREVARSRMALEELRANGSLTEIGRLLRR